MKDIAKPYIDKNDNIIIPHNCEESYKWWAKKGDSEAVECFLQTLWELGRTDLAERYIFKP